MPRLILLLFCLISACTQREIPDQKTLVVALSAAPSTLDPRRTTDATGQRITSLIFNSLVRTGSDLRTTADAAESWTYKNLTYTFLLRPDLTFSNGRAVTPEDVQFTFQQYMKPDSPFQSTLSMIKEVSVSRKDQQQIIVQLHLTKFHAPLLDDLSSVKILPQPEAEKAGDDFGRQPIGTGSFVLTSQDSHQIQLQARETHAFQKPNIKNVIFKIIQDDATRVLKTLKGAVDIAQQEIPPHMISKFENSKEFRVIKYNGLSMNYVLINFKNEALAQQSFRKALAHALNIFEIIKFKLNDLAQPATSLITPAHPMFDSTLKQLEFNLEKAKTFLAQSKIKEVTLTLKTSNTPSAVENGKVIANQLEKLGIKVKLQSYEWSTFYGDVKKGNFELAIMRWVGTTDPDLYRLAFHSSETPPGRNRGSYLNKELDKLLDEGPTIEDPIKRRDFYKRIQTIVLEDLAVLPLWYDTQVAVINERVKDYQPPINGDYSGLYKAWK